MTESFDPYYRWLGISPKDQPPNHYRLLGVEPFESDPDVLESAADRQMTHVRTFQTGRHSAESQQLLNEIARAKLTLLNSSKKTAYDETLRGSIVASPPSHPPKAVATPAAAVPGFQPVSKSTARSSLSRRHARRKRFPWALLISLAAGMALLGGVIYWLTTQQAPIENGPVESPPTESNPSVSQNQPVTPKADPPVPEQKEPAAKPEDDSTKSDPAPKKPVRQRPAVSRSVDDRTVTPVDPPPAEPRPVVRRRPRQRARTLGSLIGVDADDSLPEADKLPPPSAEEQEKAEQQIREIFAEEYRAAQKRDGERPLAEMLLTEARQTTDDSPAHYVMLKQSILYASKAGEVLLAREAQRTLEAFYRIDIWPARVEALDRLGRSVRTNASRRTLARSAMDLVEPALAEHRHKAAKEILRIATAAAAKADNAVLRSEIKDLKELVRIGEREWKKVESVFKTLEENADDPEANLTVGKHYCFDQTDWTAGLPHLIKGSNAALKEMAQADLTRPAGPAEQVKLGNRWWDLAERLRSDVEKNGVKARAGYWYRLALPRLKGLERTLYEKRLEEVKDLDIPVAADRPLRPGDALPKDKWIDLLKYVRLDRDRVVGEWVHDGNTLSVKPGYTSRIMAPVTVQGSYDVELRFVRRSGNDAVMVHLPVGSSACCFMLSGWGGAADGIDSINGEDARQNATARKPSLIRNGQPYRLLIKVRTEKEMANIDISVNNKPYVRWAGPQSSLTVYGAWRIPDPARLGLGVNESEASFADVRFRLVSGEASLVGAAQ